MKEVVDAGEVFKYAELSVGTVVDPHRARISVARYESRVCMYVCMVITYSRVWINRVKVANPARGQLNRENENSPVPVRA